jgi:hypothetical protein
LATAENQDPNGLDADGRFESEDDSSLWIAERSVEFVYFHERKIVIGTPSGVFEVTPREIKDMWGVGVDYFRCIQLAIEALLKEDEETVHKPRAEEAKELGQLTKLDTFELFRVRELTALMLRRAGKIECAKIQLIGHR